MLLLLVSSARAFSAQLQQRPRQRPSSQAAAGFSVASSRGRPRQKRRSGSSTSLSVIGTGAASLLAGSVGGAIGVGVAYPLDTLKTKAQVYAQQRGQRARLNKQQEQLLLQENQQPSASSSSTPLVLDNSTAALSVPIASGVVCTTDRATESEKCYAVETPEDDLISLVFTVLEAEGIAGFFGGVKAMMIGQALIKSVAFSANELALGVLNDNAGAVAAAASSGGVGAGGGDDAATSPFVALLLAAAFSGFVTSFLVAPVGKMIGPVILGPQGGIYPTFLFCLNVFSDSSSPAH